MRSTLHFADRLEKRSPLALFFEFNSKVLGRNIWLATLFLLLGQSVRAQLAPCFATNTNAPSISVSGNNAGQSFTAGCTGQITSVVFKFQSAPAALGAMKLEIYGGPNCSGSVLATLNFTAMVSGALTTINLPAPVAVTAGSQYFLRLSTVSPNTFRVYFNGTTDPYVGGRLVWGSCTTISNSPYGTASDMYFRVNIGESANLAPEMDVLGSGISIADGDITPSPTDNTDYGTGIFGQTYDRTFTITNTGNAPLNLTGSPLVQIGGTHPGDFTLLTPPAATIAAAGSTTFTVRFSPLAIGLRRATLNIPNNDLNENPYNFDIQGRFNCPEIVGTVTGNVLVCPGATVGKLPIDVYSSQPWPPYRVKLSDNSVHTVRDGATILNVAISPTIRNFSIVSVVDSFGCAGTATGTAIVIERDIEVPTIMCPAAVTINAAPGFCTATPAIGTATATDNCTTPTITNNAPNPFPVGTTVVTWTAMDPSTNAATCSQTVIVYDVTPPSITCPADVTVQTDDDCCIAIPDYTGLATVSDECTPTVQQCINNDMSRTLIPECLEPGDDLCGVGDWFVTLTVSDPSGNTATCDFLLTVADTSVPTIICPNNLTVNVNEYDELTKTGGLVSKISGCGYSPYYDYYYGLAMLYPVIEDNCVEGAALAYTLSGATETIEPIDGYYFMYELLPTGVTTVTWIVTDPGGNTASCSFDVTVNDSIAPFIACGGLPSVNLNACGIYTAGTELDPAYDDNCAVASLTYTLTGNTVGTGSNTLSGVMFQQGPTTIEWLVTDESGNTSSCSVMVTVGDFEAPTVTCPASLTVNTDAGQCTFTDDPMAPVTAVTPYDNCLQITTYSLSGATSGTGLAVDLSGVALNKGVTTATFTVSDQPGNTGTATTCSFDITVVDNQAPVITCPAAATVTGCTYLIAGTAYDATVTDNCSADLYWSMTGGTENMGSVTVDGVTLGYGATTITWTADDHSGTSSATTSCTVVITVGGDATPPTFAEAAGDLDRTVECSDAAALSAAFALFPTASDDCALAGEPDRVESYAPGACPIVGAYTVTWTATDLAGNTAVYTQTITIQDNTAPTWTTPAGVLDRTVECDDILGFAVANGLIPTYSDCDMSQTPVKAEGTIVNGSCPNLLVGTYTHTFVVTDSCGNPSAPYTQVITVIDTKSPTWVDAPRSLDMTLSCSDAAGLASAQSLQPVPQDGCSQTANITVQKYPGAFVAGSCPNAGTYTNTFIATDECGNTSTTFTQVITVFDAGNPTWLTAAGSLDRTVSCSDAAGLAAAQALLPTATDACDLSVTVTKRAGTLTGGAVCGTITNMFTAVDDCGNVVVSPFTQVITIVDLTLPTITCPANVTVAVGATCSYTLPAYTPATLSDNCGTPGVTQSPAAGTVLSSTGVTTVSLTATDACGNSRVCSFNVTRIDNTNPTISCPTATALVLSSPTCSATLPAYTPTAVSDNCTASPTVTQSPAAGTAITTVGTRVVTLSATDAAGRTGTCSISVSVTSTATPTVTCPASKIVSLNGSCQFVLPNYTTEATVNYPCSGASTLTQSPIAGTTLTGVTVRTIVVTATTPDGKTATCSFTVTTQDNTAPVVTCPSTQNLEMGTGCRATIPDYRPLATWTDNCTAGGSILKSQLAPYTIGTAVTGLGPITVVLRAQDAAGRTSTCSFTVNRVDFLTPFCSGDAGNGGVTDRENAVSEEALDFELAPNPAVDQVNLNVFGLKTAALVSVVDQLGRTVWEQRIQPEQANLLIRLDAAQFDSGLYLVTVRSDGSMVTKRLVLTK